MKKIEIWGNLESSLIRMGDDFVSPSKTTLLKESDLLKFKELGIKKLEYTCHWEKLASRDLDHIDWSLIDEDLNLLKSQHIEVTISFLNHGSGPLYTSLIDPDFHEKFQTFARQFATRYPWINEYTPIRDINLTARRSCLEGKWYPHLRDELYYLKAILHQVKASVLAMREIRSINPKGKLIQSENFGKWFSSEELLAERDFENERRWLAIDLMMGNVTPEHKLFNYALEQGIREDELQWFHENAFTPSIIGMNLDLDSYRYLDHQLHLYPESSYDEYRIKEVANISAVDTGQTDIISILEMIQEVYERYHLPVAITDSEIRFYPGRETPMRWLAQIWDGAKKVSQSGIDVVAVTASHLLGSSYHQHSSGVITGNRETALGKLIRDLSQEGQSDIPILKSEGVWETSRRIQWGAKSGEFTRLYHKSNARPILVLGSETALGEAVARVCGERNIAYKSLRRREMDITDIDSIEQALEVYKPWAIINAVGYIRVDEAESLRSECYQENVSWAVNLARACRDHDISLVNFSSDLVFDGKSLAPYVESNVVAPVNVYGKTKAESESQVLSIYPKSLIIRTSAFFGPWDEMNFVTQTLKSLASKNEVLAPNDMFVSPTYVPDLVNECLNLLIDGEQGIVHLANAGDVSWQELATLAVATAKDQLHLDPHLIKGISVNDLGLKAKRPEHSALESEFFSSLPSLEDALDRYIAQLQVPIFSQQEIRQ